MIPSLRNAYEGNFDPANWERRMIEVAKAFGSDISQMLAPTPLFLPHSLLKEMNGIGQDIFQLLTVFDDPRLPGDEIVPAVWRWPDESKAPSMVNIDFALTRQADGRIVPRVLEMQGFPSYYFSQLYLSRLCLPSRPLPARHDYGSDG